MGGRSDEFHWISIHYHKHSLDARQCFPPDTPYLHLHLVYLLSLLAQWQPPITWQSTHLSIETKIQFQNWFNFNKVHFNITKSARFIKTMATFQNFALILCKISGKPNWSKDTLIYVSSVCSILFELVQFHFPIPLLYLCMPYGHYLTNFIIKLDSKKKNRCSIKTGECDIISLKTILATNF